MPLEPDESSWSYCRGMRDVIGAVLAGGASTRMGADKALIEVGGRPMATWVADALGQVCSRSIVVGRRRQLGELETVPDLVDGPLGPLSGLVTALDLTKRPVLLVAVDQPLVRIETLVRLADLGVNGHTAVCIDEIEQVTCAVYGADLRDVAHHELSTGGSIRSLLRRVAHTRVEPSDWKSWGEDGRSWFSMDSPDDIVEAERRFRLDLLG